MGFFSIWRCGAVDFDLNLMDMKEIYTSRRVYRGTLSGEDWLSHRQFDLA